MWRCEACETTIPADSAFCPYCGRAVAVEPPAPEPQREAESPPAPTAPHVRRLALTPQAGGARREALPRALGLAAQPIDRLVAVLGGILTVVGFLAAVAGGRGGYPWLGLGIAALAASIYLRLDRFPQDH